MRIFFLLVVLLSVQSVVAQQETNITNYVFNPLAYNPATAGVNGYFSSVFSHRAQWVGWANDAGRIPTTTFLNAHSPISKRVGLGLHLSRDVIGVTASTGLQAAYAYRFELPFGKLSIGLQAGLFNWTADWNQLSFKDQQAADPAFNSGNPSRTIPNFGAGIFFESEYYYVGLSFPKFIPFDLRTFTEDEFGLIANAKSYRTTYLVGGGYIPILSDDIVFQPSILIRKVGTFGRARSITDQPASPTSVDLTPALSILETFWLGINYRFTLEGLFSSTPANNSLGFWGAFFFQNGMKLGLSYDATLSPIRQYSYGAFELLVGYDLNYRFGKVESPRYF